jgi:hypothetical protein
MRDVELYRHLLGLESPWTVRSVELNVPEQRVDVWAHHPEGIRWPCPECGADWDSTTTPRNVSGAIWTVASS